MTEVSSPQSADDADRIVPRLPATVLVCTRDRGELVRGCAQSLAASLGPADELLVVEAASDSARDVVASLGDPRCRWLRVEAPGKSRQLNAGILAARNDVVVITDDDCEVHSGWVERMASPFSEPDVGIAFGPVDGVSRIPGMTASFPPPGPSRTEGTWGYGASMSVRAVAACDVGGFDERLGPGAPVHGEEADLALRMQSAGWRCWMADAPPVEHIEWRSGVETVTNLLVYERGGGAWVGAALRRDPLGAARWIETRLRYQADLFSSAPSKRFAARALLAFCAGVLAGLRLAPARFLPQDPSSLPPGDDSPARGPSLQFSCPDATPARLSSDDQAAIETPVWEQTIEIAPGVVTAGRIDLRHALPLLPWPSVRGKRCLDLCGGEGLLAFELERRGAAELVSMDLVRDRAGFGRASEDAERRLRFELAARIRRSRAQWRSATLAQLASGEFGMFDVIVATGLLARDELPGEAFAAISRLGPAYFLSVEALELGLSIFGRGQPLARLDARPGVPTSLTPSGAAHKQLLEAAGFEVQNVSRPFVGHTAADRAIGGAVRRRILSGAQWVLTGDRSAGIPMRALLCRPAG